MVDRDLIAAKLAELADRIARVRTRCPPTAEALRDDRDALDVVSFNLMLAVQSCADIASHIIADQGWPPASNLASGFNRLRDEEVLSTATAAALCKAVGLRNVVVLHVGEAAQALVAVGDVARASADFLPPPPGRAVGADALAVVDDGDQLLGDPLDALGNVLDGGLERIHVVVREDRLVGAGNVRDAHRADDAVVVELIADPEGLGMALRSPAFSSSSDMAPSQKAA